MPELALSVTVPVPGVNVVVPVKLKFPATAILLLFKSRVPAELVNVPAANVGALKTSAPAVI